MADLGSGSAAARASSGASASGSASARGSSSSFSSLEDACRASERARLLAPGLAMHEGTPVGTSPAPRPDVQARLEAHALGAGEQRWRDAGGLHARAREGAGARGAVLEAYRGER